MNISFDKFEEYLLDIQEPFPENILLKTDGLTQRKINK